MVMAGDFRKGVTIEYNNSVYTIVDFQHVKPGKGAAFVRAKIKDVMNGSVLEQTFNPADKYPKAHIETKTMEYLYNDGELYYFMDNETYEQLPLNRSQVEDALLYIKENMPATIQFFKGKAFSVMPPNFVVLRITATEPGFAGDTSQGARKPATLETGLEIQVPLFVEQDELVRIDTRTGEYMERARQ